MAKLTSGIFGPISGKVGGLVGASWKNIPYIRSKPQKTTKPPTVAQIANREKFRFLNELLVPFYPFLTVGFKNMARGKTEINVAFTQNFNGSIIGTYPDLSVDYAKLILSKGTLPPLISVEATMIGMDLIKATWEPNSQGTFDDQVMLVVFSPELKIADGFVGGVKRRDKECTFRFNPKLIGKSLEAYITIVTLNGARVGNTQYLGRVNP
nr:DUF6266 family protein [Pedobacter panaciterrae]